MSPRLLRSPRPRVFYAKQLRRFVCRLIYSAISGSETDLILNGVDGDSFKTWNQIRLLCQEVFGGFKSLLMRQKSETSRMQLHPVGLGQQLRDGLLHLDLTRSHYSAAIKVRPPSRRCNLQLCTKLVIRPFS